MSALRLLPFVFLLACQQPAGLTRVDTAGLEALLRADSTVQLIDLRTPAEIAQTGRIAGARNLDFKDPDFWNQLDALDRSRPVVLYCAAGSRSARTGAELVQMGFPQVYDYADGMNTWAKAGKPTE
jgi:rhodanese-related sulfurtransferase